MVESSTLPHGLTDALHYPSPAWLLLALAALIGSALALLLWWFWNRTKKAAAAPSSKPRTGTAATPGGLAAEIDQLRRRFVESGDYRAGCHALALLLREHFTRKRGRRLSFLTAREIGIRLSDLTVGSLFELLADLQFRRASPSQEDFESVCDLAADGAKGKLR